MAKKKSKPVITQTLVTDGKIILSKEELVELIRMKYPEFPAGECTVGGVYGDSCDYEANDLRGIIVDSTKSEKYDG